MKRCMCTTGNRPASLSRHTHSTLYNVLHTVCRYPCAVTRLKMIIITTASIVALKEDGGLSGVTVSVTITSTSRQMIRGSIKHAVSIRTTFLNKKILFKKLPRCTSILPGGIQLLRWKNLSGRKWRLSKAQVAWNAWKDWIHKKI